MDRKITTVKLKNEEIQEYIGLESPEFPKYVTTFINRANRFSQATRPENVGQLSELIKEFPGRTVSEWESWYCERYPDTIRIATDKIANMIQNFREALDKVTHEMIEKWVKDLVIIKTFIGLHFQEAILKKVAEIKGTTYRLSNEEEESKGIDGFIGSISVSIKPYTYKEEKELKEKIPAKIIYYEKLDDGVEVDFSEL
ncbi:MjaI family restriction endonuclease [Patescibacteria group bacterium]|nr:MjaI family restriction endonuclease [Patescibacteria group bacterium]